MEETAGGRNSWWEANAEKPESTKVVASSDNERQKCSTVGKIKGLPPQSCPGAVPRPVNVTSCSRRDLQMDQVKHLEMISDS